MKTFGILAASFLYTTMLSAQHAKVAAAKPASASPASERPTTASKLAAKPEPGHAPAAKPAQRAADVRVHGLPDRPIKRRSTAYWRNFCFHNPYAAVCQDPDFVAQQNTPSRVAPTVILDPYAPTRQPAAPKSMLVNQTVFAPAEPIVKVSDEVAANVSVGASQADIRQKLGEPHSMISGGPERYTYFLQSGGSLQLDFEDGRVTQVRNTSN
jgi:hypothetical protein